MSIIKNKQRIEKLDYLIRHQATGNLCECAKKIGISRRQLYYLIEVLNDLEIPIIYNKEKKQLEYSKEGKLKLFAFEPLSIGKDELSKIKGGNGSFFQKNSFVQCHCTHLGLALVS